ncbi:histidinol-phosphate transaminase [Candidatus Igneacidithiobacillus taiwanensis]|uniref:histidinol-phosphate transaminase n=2 Tax=Candidatus Igneacidithiobacillus taiwanensis TaxID=1945924 RepID=UPI0028A2B304|nr:histidinol-phosphate transaminase [Candidatus Igneacidithiobacillus taiwanensis]
MSEPSLQERLLRPTVLASRAYAVAPSDGFIKLDAMENPYALPASLRSAWLAALQDADLHRYPSPRPEALMRALAEHGGIPPEMGMLLGNGSDELIQILISAVAGAGRPVLAVEPSFVMYRIIAEQQGLAYHSVALDADFQLDLSAFLAEMERCQPAIVFLDWPNNPSGQMHPVASLEAICAAAPGLVVVDEAYHAFSADSFAGHLGRWPNLLLLRTLSKEGLAGLRLGFLAGPPAWIDELDKLRLPYNINILTQKSVAFALRHAAVFAEQAQEICAEREFVYERLRALGIQVWPSRANFLLFALPGRANAVHAGLKEAGILIKAFTGHPRLGDHLRVSIGTPPENRAFLAALEELL